MKAKYVLIVSYFYILLFVYAAISKLITFEAFQVQLTQSPLLSAYANIIAYLVLGAELLFALLLCLKTTRLLGLYLSYGLMVAFTLYIYLILNYSDFIPCSCGGILEKMGWNEHLWFNIIVSLLALVALFFEEHKRKRFYLGSITTTIISCILVILLFLSSEHIIKKENPFIRRYLPHGVFEDKVLNLGYDSFYFAGYHNQTVYLGNHTAALRIGIVDSTMSALEDFNLTIDNENLPFRSIQLKVLYPYFYLADGYIPIIFKGKIGEWQAKTMDLGPVYFSSFQPLDSMSVFFRGQSSSTKENVLGKISLDKENKIILNTALLEKQIDGVFDTDGTLRYSKEQKKLVYTYFYRNQYIVSDTDLNLLYRGSTIDTTSIAQLEVTKLKNGEHKISAPATVMNKNVVLHRNLLFNISNSIGKTESKNMWKQAAIIDVYDYEEQVYLGSFYIHNRNDNRLTDMLVTDHYLYGLFDKELVRFQLAGLIKDKFTNPGKD